MNTTKYRIEMSTNTMARHLDGARTFFGMSIHSCKHNGGKTIVVTVESDYETELESLCDMVHNVHSYDRLD